MSYHFVLDPDDGTPPVFLEFDVYKRLFPALAKASPSYLAPLKRFRGPHAKLLAPHDSLAYVLGETERIRKHTTDSDCLAFLDKIDAIARHAHVVGASLRGISP